MARRSKPAAADKPPRWYRGTDVSMRLIRRFARRVAEKFDPDRIILFGSHAYGTPHADSDVDILVVMPARNELDQAIRICLAVERQFPVDLVVRTPKRLKMWLDERESFHTEIVTRGKVLYEKNDPRMGAKGGRRLPGRPRTRAK